MKEEELFGDRKRNATRLLNLISLGCERLFFDCVCLHVSYKKQLLHKHLIIVGALIL